MQGRMALKELVTYIYTDSKILSVIFLHLNLLAVFALNSKLYEGIAQWYDIILSVFKLDYPASSWQLAETITSLSCHQLSSY